MRNTLNAVYIEQSSHLLLDRLQNTLILVWHRSFIKPAPLLVNTHLKRKLSERP